MKRNILTILETIDNWVALEENVCIVLFEKAQKIKHDN